jgi:hypothetical protein
VPPSLAGAPFRVSALVLALALALAVLLVIVAGCRCRCRFRHGSRGRHLSGRRGSFRGRLFRCDPFFLSCLVRRCFLRRNCFVQVCPNGRGDGADAPEAFLGNPAFRLGRFQFSLQALQPLEGCGGIVLR